MIRENPRRYGVGFCIDSPASRQRELPDSREARRIRQLTLPARLGGAPIESPNLPPPGVVRFFTPAISDLASDPARPNNTADEFLPTRKDPPP